MATTILRTSEETIAFGHALAGKLEAGDVIALSGELGAGKTHLVKGLAAGLGTECAVTSPTFTLIHEYRGGRLPLFHADWYRIDDEQDLMKIGMDDYLAEEGVVVVEWADKFPKALSARTRWIEFRFLEDGSREVTER
ncbi:MAG: tRNA (adenosine(37)-N6)-threonylcarbamoyltransferase complex ATPase subunit type 1 TsaE [Chthoniobacteraceae bacterium]